LQRIFFNNALFASGEIGYRLFAIPRLLRANTCVPPRRKIQLTVLAYRVHAMRGASRFKLSPA
jgi:hypothetical protein